MTNNWPNITVISLKEAQERRKLASDQLNATGLAWKFLDATPARTMQDYPMEYDRTRRLRHAGQEMTKGEIACFLSHRAAWIDCVSSQQQTLILEDDFLLKNDLKDLFNFIANNAIPFDVLRLQGIVEVKFKTIKDYGDKKLVIELDDPGGAAAYIVKPHSAKILLERSQRFFVPVDHFMAQDWKHHLKVVVLLPYPIATQSIASSIPNRNKPSLNIKDKIFRELYRLPGRIMKKLHRTWKILRV